MTQRQSGAGAAKAASFALPKNDDVRFARGEGLLLSRAANMAIVGENTTLWFQPGGGLKVLRYGHIRQAKTGVIDFFYEQYLKAEAETGIGFREWIETVYDRDALNASFKANWAAKVLVDRILQRE